VFPDRSGLLGGPVAKLAITTAARFVFSDTKVLGAGDGPLRVEIDPLILMDAYANVGVVNGRNVYEAWPDPTHAELDWRWQDRYGGEESDTWGFRFQFEPRTPDRAKVDIYYIHDKYNRHGGGIDQDVGDLSLVLIRL